MTSITLKKPWIEGRAAHFSWVVEPPTPLYRKTDFALKFPHPIDPAQVPSNIWWAVFLTCLHSHWPLLRPCRVFLPVRLPPGTREFWQRLLESESVTLDAHRKDRQGFGVVEIVEGDQQTAPFEKLAAQNGLCAAAFSGGKDSLLSAGLLCEYTKRPVLVTTTSPIPHLNDHNSARRRHILAQIAARRDVLLIEVRSNFRSAYDNDFGSAIGYQCGVNEVSDTFLYFGTLLAVGVALGAVHLFLASEAEVQENIEREGTVIQHSHYMYSSITQRVLEELLRPAGIRYSSLISPLHSAQVSELLWRRFPDLADLQYSCWRLGPDEANCSSCRQCFRLALAALFVGGNPQRMGTDLVKLLIAMRDWQPRPSPPPEGNGLLPKELVKKRADKQIIRYIQQIPLRRIADLLSSERLNHGPEEVRQALKAYAQLRLRLRNFPAGDAPGYRAGFIAQIDPLLREPMAGLYAREFVSEAENGYEGILERGKRLVEWITEPLRRAASRS